MSKKEELDRANRSDSHILLDDFLDRYRDIHEQKTDLQAQIKELDADLKTNLAEMKAQGFSLPALRIVMKRFVETVQEREKRLELQAEVDTYLAAANLEDN